LFWISEEPFVSSTYCVSKEDPMVVYAVSAGYKWFFAYPEQKVETVNTLTPFVSSTYCVYNHWIFFTFWWFLIIV
jgi:heme/copper-type cytochrome/quinol oxidase subunit 2